MPRIVSDTQELHRVGETSPPTSMTIPTGSSVSSRLLATLCQLQPASSLPETIAVLLRACSEVLPGYALGVRLPSNNDHPEVLLTFPPTETRPARPWKPNATLFPMYAHERRIPLTCRPSPASLHCASDNPNLDSDDSSISQTLTTTANVISTAIRFVDAHQDAIKRQQEIDKLQSVLVHTDRLASLGEISVGIVHELANPLTSIVAYTDYLREKAERRGHDPEDVERLQRVGEAAELILSFTRSIVSYARPDDDVPCPVSVCQVVDQALVLCKHVIDDSNVVVHRCIDAGLPYVRSNRGQLTQVVVNLVTNACQAVGETGGEVKLTVSLDDDGRAVVLRVDDTGPGIAPQHLTRVFDPFFTTKADGFGTGLGLNIVHQIVMRCGGSVRVESPPGDGASFIVSLPVHAPDVR